MVWSLRLPEEADVEGDVGAGEGLDRRRQLGADDVEEALARALQPLEMAGGEQLAVPLP